MSIIIHIIEQLNEIVDVKDNTCADFKKEVNYKDPKFKVGSHVIVSKYKNIFCQRIHTKLV